MFSQEFCMGSTVADSIGPYIIISIVQCIYKMYIADSMKVALGIRNWALGSYCLVVTEANHYIVLYA